MKSLNWQFFLGLLLVVLSAAIYFIHYLIFRDPHHIFIFLLGDIAFVFIEVLLVTLIIHQLLALREKRVLREKLNMIVGSFFSEVGTELLVYLSNCDSKLDDIRRELVVTEDLSEQDLQRISRRLRGYDYEIDASKVSWNEIHSFFAKKRDFMVRLLENPNLLEQESFTELLRAVFHLTEELDFREDLTALPERDYDHLAGDVERVYVLLILQWFNYMKYLKRNYPYLFSLAVRTNPFDINASPEIK